MTDFNCCNNAKWDMLADMGHADSFDFILGQCSNCKKYWANVFCTATAISAYEPVTDEDANKLLEQEKGIALKIAISEWLHSHL